MRKAIKASVHPSQHGLRVYLGLGSAPGRAVAQRHVLLAASAFGGLGRRGAIAIPKALGRAAEVQSKRTPERGMCLGFCA